MREVGCQRGDTSDIQNLRRVAERLVVLLQLLKLVRELRDLLHLVVNHVNVFGDIFGFIQNLLNVADGVIDDPLRTGGERQRQGDGDYGD